MPLLPIPQKRTYWKKTGNVVGLSGNFDFSILGNKLFISSTTGYIGFGTDSPQNVFETQLLGAPVFQRNINSGTIVNTQAAIQIGLGGTATYGAGSGPSFLFFAPNSAGTKSFLGRLSARWEDPTSGSERAAIVFQVRSSGADVNATREVLRATSAGNVGIGIQTPSEKLEVDGNIKASGGVISHFLIKTISVNYTLALADDGYFIQSTAGSAITVTIPANSSVAFLVGTEIILQKYGAGNVTVAAGTGVTLRDPLSLTTISTQYDMRVLRKIGTDEWLITR
jgi:hypothetical protein